MSQQRSSVLDRLRQPEYTGENRCVPCTVVNVVIALAASAVLALASPPVGAAAFVLSLAAIYLRGYLVPGTPELTKRYLPDALLRQFGKDPVAERLEDEVVADADVAADAAAATADKPADRGGPAAGESGSTDGGDDGDATDGDQDEPQFETLEKIQRERESAVDEESFLLEAGVIESVPDGEGAFDADYAFTDEFEAAARERVPASVEDVGRDRLAPMFEVDPEEVQPKDRDYPAYRVGVRVRKWPSAAAKALDVATFEAIGERSDRWEEVPMEQRIDTVEWLRGFYDTCPTCGGAVAFDDGVIESCCGQFEVTTLACTECGVRLREFDPSKVGNRQALKGLRP